MSMLEFISKRQSKDIILGFCGFVGCGIKTTIDVTKETLKVWGYDVVHVRLSDIMQDELYFDQKLLVNILKSKKNRHLKLQEVGNLLRRKFKRNEILSEAAIAYIQLKQKEIIRSKVDESEKEKTKIAFLVDQFKRPEEIELFRVINQHNFYLLGILRDEQERIRNLKEDDSSKNDIPSIINIDNKSDDDFGQQTGKAILESDFFIKNNQSQKSDLKKKIDRFIGLIHGVNGLTPMKHEKGMYAAFSASLQSACLSRQVGAALTDSEGNLLAVGKNDVPKFGGGLYSYDDGDNDHRCVYKSGKCFNDINKIKIKNRISEILNNSLTEILNSDKIGFKEAKETIEENLEKITSKIYKESKISQVMEYSRSIHAEMDVITSMARSSNENTKGKILYTTTYPCHNCARHIVSAGIKEVIYIEPFEKSLALDLHDDSISKYQLNDKVVFKEFEGVSPRRYNKFFYPTDERKDDFGIAKERNTKYKNHIDIQYLDSYRMYQLTVSKKFIEEVAPNSDKFKELIKN
ncbi:deaminase [Providencia rettgeri]|uniref:anti-phage dCTP deaminase n=1 Tax=Providencia rettgeri TaxID=587 RepID=UPI001EE74EB2|nr:anti-phage dCTP deaminase [Providencia rettgeri]MCG5293664.1 deaminase [Providencia rettgeri]